MRTTIAASFAAKPAANMVGKPKRVANNTFTWTRADGATVTRLHLTDIVIRYPDGSVQLDTGGWKTATTKDRLSGALPAGYSLYSDRGTWTVSRRLPDGTRDAMPFYDGMVLPAAFERAADRAKAASEAKAANAWKLAVSKFVCAALPNGKPAPEPSAGDCWYCAAFDREEPATPAKFRGGAEDRPAKPAGSVDHLRSHVEEGYMPGWLVVNAFRAAGYQDAGIGFWMSGKDQTVTRRVVKRYLLKKLGVNTK